MAVTFLSDLGVNLPVLAAPMAGGPGTAALVTAAARAGSLGFVAAGYKSPQALAEEITAVAGTGLPFGVNLFAPNPQPIDPVDFRTYAGVIAPEAERYGVSLDGDKPREDDDSWQEKLEVLRAHPVPLISFTFGIPAARDLAALRATGALLIQTVTSAEEAAAAADAGVDALAVQSAQAGGHFGTLTPSRPAAESPLAEVVAAVHRSVDLPLIATGGLATPADVAGVMHAGASAVAVGTVLLRSDEAGTTAAHRAALADPARESVRTRAFTGRPARGLRNEFIERYECQAPLGYPAVHYLTSPLRKAAAAAGDPERVHLWAGIGFRHATDEPAAAILTRLAGQL
ncbi:MAG TPA: nitronate monooxygenase [Thermoleophilia bacterium]|nr:nitronate monooxygenase [Thermoleophilia bacterium]